MTEPPRLPVAVPEFDKFAGRYGEMHARNISASGESPEYFAAYKMSDFAGLVRRYGSNAGGRFLDFGSGVGSCVVPFKQCLPDGHLVCADVSAHSLEFSRAAHGQLVEYLQLEEGALPLPDQQLDGAFACCVFHHIPHEAHGRVLGEIHRALRPGAPFMLYEHNPLNPLTVHAVNTCPLDENAVLIGAREMARRLTDAEFVDVKIEFRVFFPAVLRALRFMEDYLRWLPLGAQYMVHGCRW